LTISAFCQREGLAPSSFYYWRQRISRSGRKPVRGIRRAKPSHSGPGEIFAPVSVVGDGEAANKSQPSKSDDASIELVLSSGIFIRVRPDFDPVTLRRLLSALDDTRC
jgi:hypothetical protein